MLIESDDDQLWDYNEEKQYLLRISDGCLIEGVLPEQLEEIRITKYTAYFKKDGYYHRENGPAIMYIGVWDDAGLWYLNGDSLKYKEWLKRTNKC